ncbi:MAG: protein translocase SEC61 complex subunit gamma [Candidatus Aenigmarchaeota archaeon]|nr:protein translocase SEC61 complex subunit gamma [Candidatus Aenigmarchaeota archaeon]
MGLRSLIERMRRILMVASKPDKSEYRQTVKITGLGMVLIGLIGFVIFIIVQLIGGL